MPNEDVKGLIERLNEAAFGVSLCQNGWTAINGRDVHARDLNLAVTLLSRLSAQEDGGCTLCDSASRCTYACEANVGDAPSLVPPQTPEPSQLLVFDAADVERSAIALFYMNKTINPHPFGWDEGNEPAREDFRKLARAALLAFCRNADAEDAVGGGSTLPPPPSPPLSQLLALSEALENAREALHDAWTETGRPEELAAYTLANEALRSLAEKKPSDE